VIPGDRKSVEPMAAMAAPARVSVTHQESYLAAIGQVKTSR
jgi:hypothetical protein